MPLCEKRYLRVFSNTLHLERMNRERYDFRFQDFFSRQIFFLIRLAQSISLILTTIDCCVFIISSSCNRKAYLSASILMRFRINDGLRLQRRR